jgi:hypothetical protein
MMLVTGPRLFRIYRVDVPQHLAARAQNLPGTAIVDQLLTMHALHEAKPEVGFTPGDDGRHWQ